MDNNRHAIFVSHASVDKDIADKVVDIFDTAMGIDVNDVVFCTSLEGFKIPPGVDFKEFIKGKIQSPKIVVLLISKNYLNSQFCLAEVGASWVLSHITIPLLIPPIEKSDMKAILGGIQVLKILDPESWNSIYDLIESELPIKTTQGRWEKKRDENILAIESLLPNQPAVPFVTLKKFQAIERKLLDANNAIRALELEVERKDKVLSLAKKAKSLEEITRAEIDSMPEWESFIKLCETAKSNLGNLPRVVRDCIYKSQVSQHFTWPSFPNESESAEIQSAIDDDYLIEDDGQIDPNDEDPKVKRAVESLHELRKYISEHENVSECYEDEYDHRLLFGSKRFWAEHLL